MMGKVTKFHFIPLLLGTCLFGIGILYNFNIPDYEKKNSQHDSFSINIYGTILSIFIVISLFIIYAKLYEIKNEAFLKYLLIRKGILFLVF